MTHLGFWKITPHAFDTRAIDTGPHTDAILQRALHGGANLRKLSATALGVSLDETTTRQDVMNHWQWFATQGQLPPSFHAFETSPATLIPESLSRHRHFPKQQVSNPHPPDTKPRVAAAARDGVQRQGGGSTGWLWSRGRVATVTAVASATRPC